MANNDTPIAVPISRIGGPQSIVAEGLRLLLSAHDYAHHTSTELWQFALESDELRRGGLTNNEFRWLLAKGYVKQAQEITLPGDDKRSFRLLGRLILQPDSCFVLTEAGVRVAREVGQGPVRNSSSSSECVNGDSAALVARPVAGNNGQTPSPKPTWDGERKELRLGGTIVKLFKWPACNQEIILRVFEEEGWPARIDDPLPMTVERSARRRLHDTIKCLNRSHKNPLIHFRGDGSGEGVIWEFTPEALSKPRPRPEEGAQAALASTETAGTVGTRL